MKAVKLIEDKPFEAEDKSSRPRLRTSFRVH